MDCLRGSRIEPTQLQNTRYMSNGVHHCTLLSTNNKKNNNLLGYLKWMLTYQTVFYLDSFIVVSKLIENLIYILCTDSICTVMNSICTVMNKRQYEHCHKKHRYAKGQARKQEFFFDSVANARINAQYLYSTTCSLPLLLSCRFRWSRSNFVGTFGFERR